MKTVPYNNLSTNTAITMKKASLLPQARLYIPIMTRAGYSQLTIQALSTTRKVILRANGTASYPTDIPLRVTGDTKK